MTDKPIIFSAPMVQALLAGRKSQTRRVLKHKSIDIGIAPTADGDHPEWIQFHHPLGGPLTCVKWPYAPGDRLWVREAFWTCEDCGYCNHVVGANSAGVGDRKCCAACDTMLPKPKTSPIFMPRYNSRLTMTVTDVRVQRLTEITLGDCWAEGCQTARNLIDTGFIPQGHDLPFGEFRAIWESIHGPDAWDANPWVCAITFKTEKRNIDQ